jgi:hypothetical protein
VHWATSLDEQTAWSPYTTRADGGSFNHDDLPAMLETGREMVHRTGPVDRVTTRGDKDGEHVRTKTRRASADLGGWRVRG